MKYKTNRLKYIKKIHSKYLLKRNNLVPTIDTASYPLLPLLTIPTKLLNISTPTFAYPQNVNVIISKTETIDYERGVGMNVLLNEFLAYSNGDWRCAVAQMPLHTYQLPHLITTYFKNIISKVNLWYYLQNRVSTWHYDGYDNFLFVLEGSKVIALLPPNCPQVVYKCAFDTNNNHAQNSPKSSVKVRIAAKECLFIPRGWWHHVSSYVGSKGNIAINVWGNGFQDIQPKVQLLRQLMYSISEEQCERQYANWDQLPSQVKCMERKKTFVHKYLSLF